jgi:citronellol/citronellal dehydrogenase
MKTIFREGTFADRTVLITGGGTGIGLRTALEFGLLGASVAIASRKPENLEAGLSELRNAGVNCMAAVCNIRDEESVKACISEVMERFGPIHVLVNNGGGQFPSPAEFINRKGWTAVIETNLTGTFFMCQEVFNRCMAQHGGSIVSVTVDNRNGFPMMVHTGAARAGVENLTRTLANEWGRYGVRINCVAPGTIASSGLDRYDPQFREFIYGYGKNNQTHRLGTEAEVASAIVFLSSPAASFITGQTLRVDGGQSIYNPLFPPADNDRNPPFGA